MGVTDGELRAALCRVLGVPEGQADFHRSPDQLSIVRDIVRGRDVLAVMPTGGGKSVCYQVPALCLPGVTLVVSPLVALIEDQGEALHRNGVAVACLAGGFLLDRDGPHVYTGEESAGLRARRDRIFYDAARGLYKLLYVTPERLRTGAFIRFVQNAHISLIAVDEAHCVSLWGYEFRPRYLEITRLEHRMDSRPAVAAFTATATEPVREDIRRFLGLERPREYVYPAVRDNLRFSVRSYKSEARRLNFITKYVLDRPGQSGIVYCATAAAVDRVYERLRERGAQALRYYARLDEGGGPAPLSPGESRRANLEAFRRGRGVMVATTALGMGIDKGDLRYVIHCGLPLSMEDYFQEAGRAGRDGMGGECVLCLAEGDEQVSRALMERTLRESGLAGETLAARRRVAQEKLRAVLAYCREDAGALPGFIERYFGPAAPGTEDPALSAARADMEERVRQIDAVYANRTRVAGELRRGHTSGTDLAVGRAGRSGPAPTVSYRLTGEALTYFDMMVADAVYTLMKNRVRTVTARSVMELLSGNPALTLRPERRAAVEASLRRMMACRLEIDRRGSAGYGFVYPREGDRTVISGPFLPLFEKRGGFGYDRGTLPPLYEYAEILNGQFYVLPTERLRVPDLPTSAENLALTWYLLLRVGSMGRRGPGRASTSRSIRLDTLLETLDLRLPEGKYERARRLAAIADKERAILEHLRALGVIRGFEADRETGSFTVELPGRGNRENS